MDLHQLAALLLLFTSLGDGLVQDLHAHQQSAIGDDTKTKQIWTTEKITNTPLRDSDLVSDFQKLIVADTCDQPYRIIINIQAADVKASSLTGGGLSPMKVGDGQGAIVCVGLFDTFMVTSTHNKIQKWPLPTERCDPARGPTCTMLIRLTHLDPDPAKSQIDMFSDYQWLTELDCNCAIAKLDKSEAYPLSCEYYTMQTPQQSSNPAGLFKVGLTVSGFGGKYPPWDGVGSSGSWQLDCEPTLFDEVVQFEWKAPVSALRYRGFFEFANVVSSLGTPLPNYLLLTADYNNDWIYNLYSYTSMQVVGNLWDTTGSPPVGTCTFGNFPTFKFSITDAVKPINPKPSKQSLPGNSLVCVPDGGGNPIFSQRSNARLVNQFEPLNMTLMPRISTTTSGWLYNFVLPNNRLPLSMYWMRNLTSYGFEETQCQPPARAVVFMTSEQDEGLIRGGLLTLGDATIGWNQIKVRTPVCLDAGFIPDQYEPEQAATTFTFFDVAINQLCTTQYQWAKFADPPSGLLRLSTLQKHGEPGGPCSEWQFVTPDPASQQLLYRPNFCAMQSDQMTAPLNVTPAAGDEQYQDLWGVVQDFSKWNGTYKTEPAILSVACGGTTVYLNTSGGEAPITNPQQPIPATVSHRADYQLPWLGWVSSVQGITDMKWVSNNNKISDRNITFKGIFPKGGFPQVVFPPECLNSQYFNRDYQLNCTYSGDDIVCPVPDPALMADNPKTHHWQGGFNGSLLAYDLSGFNRETTPLTVNCTITSVWGCRCFSGTIDTEKHHSDLWILPVILVMALVVVAVVLIAYYRDSLPMNFRGGTRTKATQQNAGGHTDNDHPSMTERTALVDNKL